MAAASSDPPLEPQSHADPPAPASKPIEERPAKAAEIAADVAQAPPAGFPSPAGGAAPSSTPERVLPNAAAGGGAPSSERALPSAAAGGSTPSSERVLPSAAAGGSTPSSERALPNAAGGGYEPAGGAAGRRNAGGESDEPAPRESENSTAAAAVRPPPSEPSAAEPQPPPSDTGPIASQPSDSPAFPPASKAARTATLPLLEGELAPSPRSAFATIALGITGLLLLANLFRTFARFVLVVRRPAELRLNRGALVVNTRTELLGRTLRERQMVVPAGGLVHATREVLYPSLGLYVGLLSLAIGSYFGVAITVDGLRAASASMLGLGLLIVALGIGIDFVLMSLLPSRAGRARVVLLPRRGRRITIALVDARDADRLLSALKERVEVPRSSPPAAE